MADIPASLLAVFEKAQPGWLVVALVLLALIKIWPVIQLQSIQASAALRGERRVELSDCRERLAAMEIQMRGAIDRIHNVELKLTGALTAYRILDTEILSLDPNNSAVVLARAVMQQTFGEPQHSIEPPPLVAVGS